MKSRVRNAPLRSCLVCGRKTTKDELTRIVATPNGGATVDFGGKSQGRGAYVCKSGPCPKGSLKRGRLEYALRTKLQDQHWAEVMVAVEGSPIPSH